MDENAIFMAAAQIEDAALQAAFLESVCQGDGESRQRIEKLLSDFRKWNGNWEGFADRLSRPMEGEEYHAVSRPESAASPQSNASPSNASQSKGRQPSLPPGTRFSAYEIRESLGIGGMGEVYLAFDQRLARQVAIKILPERNLGNEQWVERFQREARAAGTLNHPNILTVYEVGRTEAFYFLATEYVEGSTLRECIRHRSLDLCQLLDIAAQVASALNAAHQARVIHRDVKPENIMIRPDGIVKVLDFGIAKQLGSDGGELPEHPTHGGLVVGTMSYMSPEQIQCEAIDARTDVYGIGLLLYECLHGRLPFAGLARHDSTQLSFEIPSSFRSSQILLSEMERIVRTCLRKLPEHRYPSAQALFLDLKRVRDQYGQGNVKEGSRWEVESDAVPSSSPQLTQAVKVDTDFEPPEIRYTLSGQVNIAFQVLGQGDIDLVFVMGWVSHLEWFWREPTFSRFLRRLARFARVILFDKRGTGLSDRVPVDQLPTLEQRMDDVRAVMEAVGSDRAVLCGVSEGGPMCSLFAATYPERTIALVMMGSYARRLKADDYPWGPSEEQRRHFLEEIRRHWGGPVGIESRAPSMAQNLDFRRWWATYLRMGASPGAALALTEMNAQIDVRSILSTIQVPTLVLHRSGDQCLLVEEGRYLAEQIPGAKFVELPGSDHLPFVGDQDGILDEIEQFLTGVKQQPAINRVLATVLCVKPHPLSSPNQEEERRRWSYFESHLDREIQLFRGRPAMSNDLNLLATFDGPARAVRAACAIRESAQRLGFDLQIGLHTGECEIDDKRVGGRAVELAQHICQVASANTILTSSTVKDLIAGAGIQFRSSGISPIADEFGAWQLFEVA